MPGKTYIIMTTLVEGVAVDGGYEAAPDPDINLAALDYFDEKFLHSPEDVKAVMGLHANALNRKLKELKE